jgi:Flp pilus assembly protein TadD
MMRVPAWFGQAGSVRHGGRDERPGGHRCGKREVAMTKEERYAAAEQIKDAGDLAGAVAAMEAVVAEEPEYALAHSALAAWCTRLERHDEAVRHARRACELEPRDPFSYTALSVACMRAGMIPEAEEALAKSRMLQG